ncbi:MAG: tRNA pseudouridine(55) synthase TruB [Tenericutes bacterium]|nr:tRNA pseudouridine(55) synthase TruB [Mycoplasmatota bacterium]
MKDGILVINKPKNMTSREVVNTACKKLNTRHIGHTGTLDPIATGVLVLGVNEGCKVIDLLTQEDKIYEAKVLVGVETDTLDITGNILNEYNIENLTGNDIEKALSKYRGKYNQEVPKYSAIHVNGKRLYEYARNNIEVELPKREVEVFDLVLKSFEKCDNRYTFSIISHVSKGTYIRSLIRDIGLSLGYPCTMMELTRVKQGAFTIDQAVDLEDINNDKILSIDKALTNLNSITVDNDTAKKVLNGAVLDLNVNNDKVLILNSNNELLAIYERYTKDLTKMKPYRVFRR